MANKAANVNVGKVFWLAGFGSLVLFRNLIRDRTMERLKSKGDRCWRSQVQNSVPARKPMELMENIFVDAYLTHQRQSKEMGR